MMTRRDAVGRLAALAALPVVASCGVERLTRPATAVRRLRINTVAVASAPIPLIVAGDPHFKVQTQTAAYRIADRVKARLAADPLAWAIYPGDLVENGTAQEFRDYCATALDPILDRVLPVIGNHDNKDAANKKAESYFAYFGTRAGEPGKGYYVKTFGDTWAGFFLNSQWGLAEQAAWLAAELPNYVDRHVFAVLHQPYMSAPCNHNGTRVTMNWPGFNGMGQLWMQLEQRGAEFLLSGHCHHWERYPRMLRDSSNPFTGLADDSGVRQFVCGTGGTTTMPTWTPASPHPHIEKYVQARGPVEFVLHQNHYEWTLTDYSSAATLDSGTQVCRKTVVPPSEESPPEEPPPTCS
jgi:hypothetical protein